MSLRDRLQAITDAPDDDVTPEMNAVMHRAVQTLRDSGLRERVIKVGAEAPDFQLLDQHGQPHRLSEMRRRGSLALTFYRGFWCPYCNEDLKALQEVLPAIRNAGAGLLAISPQTQPNARRAARTLNLGFPLLADPGNSVANTFGLKCSMPADLREVYARLGVNLPLINGDDSWTLPMPGRIVVERSGLISYVEADPDYTKRPEPDELVAHLLRQRTPA